MNTNEAQQTNLVVASTQVDRLSSTDSRDEFASHPPGHDGTAMSEKGEVFLMPKQSMRSHLPSRSRNGSIRASNTSMEVVSETNPIQHALAGTYSPVSSVSREGYTKSSDASSAEVAPLAMRATANSHEYVDGLNDPAHVTVINLCDDSCVGVHSNDSSKMKACKEVVAHQGGLLKAVPDGTTCRATNPLLGQISAHCDSNKYTSGSNNKPCATCEGSGVTTTSGEGVREGSVPVMEHIESKFSHRISYSECASPRAVEWLQVVELFSFFATLIEYHEMQMQQAVVGTASSAHASAASAADAAAWHHSKSRDEEEDRDLETTALQAEQDHILSRFTRLRDRITFSADEIRRVYLNPLLVHWSNMQLRGLTEAVVQTWLANSNSEACRRASVELIDAILREERGTISYSVIYRLWRFMGNSRRKVGLFFLYGLGTAVVVALTSMLRFGSATTFGSFGLTICYICIIVVAVCQVFMFAFIVHHNSFTDIAARYFRQEVLLNAKSCVSEESELVPCGPHGERELSSFISISVDEEALPRMVEGAIQRGVSSSSPVYGYACSAIDDRLRSVRNPARALDAAGQSSQPVPSLWAAPTKPHSSETNDTTLTNNTRTISHPIIQDSNNNNNQGDDKDEGCAMMPRASSGFSAHLLQTQRVSIDSSHGLDHTEHRLSGIHFIPHFTTIAEYTANVYRDENKTDGCPHHPLDTNAATLLSNETLEEDGSGGSTTQLTARQIFAGIRGRVHIIAFVFCHDEEAAQTLVWNLAQFQVDVLRMNTLPEMEQAFANAEQSLKVMLLHGPDLPESSVAQRTALRWVRQGRPVFFFGADIGAYAVHLPTSLCKEIPFREEDINTMLLAGLGVDDPNHSFVSVSPVPFKIPAYTLGRRLGGGAYGNVFEVELEKSGAKCAVKRMYLREDSYASTDLAAAAAAAGAAAADAAESNKLPRSVEHSPRAHEMQRESTAVSHESAHQTAARDMINGVHVDVYERKDDMTGLGPTGGNAPQQEEGKTKVDDAGIGVTAAAAADNACWDPPVGNDTIVGGQLRDIAEEVEIMSSLSHRNIVRYMFCDRDDNCISIFMELCTGGSLSTMLANHSIMTAVQACSILRDIISAVDYLHYKRIVHRDLKPDNVLFNDGVAKVTDFGTAVHKRGDLRLMKGTFAYMAPEVLVGEAYGKACDVWSIGCIAAEVLSVDLPQRSLGMAEMCDYYRRIPMDGALDIDCDVPAVKSFLVSCLQRNPSARPSASALLQHEILQPGSSALDAWMSSIKERCAHQHQRSLNGLIQGANGCDLNYDLISSGTPSLHSSQIF